MDRLPSGYQELTYIESNGTQWIDTKVFLSVPTDFDIYITVLSTSDYRRLYGLAYNAGNSRFQAEASGSSSFIVGNNNEGKTLTVPIATYVTVSKRGLVYSCGENSVSFANAEFINASYSVYLLAGRDRITATLIARLYGAKFYQNNTLVRDFIPCRRLSDGAIGMYDLVSQSFFGNSGTGEFIAGAPVIEPTWGSGVSQVSRKLMMRRDALLQNPNSIYFGKSEQNGTPSIRNRVDIVDSALIKNREHLYPYPGALPVHLRGVKLGTSVPSAFEAIGGIYFDGTYYWCGDTYQPSTGEYIQRIREVVMTGTAPYNVNFFYNQLTKTFLVCNYYSALTSNANDLSKTSYGPLCNYERCPSANIFFSDVTQIDCYGNNRITFCVRYPFDYWGIASGEKTDTELIALVNALLKERYEAGVPYVFRYVLRNPIVSIL